MMDWGATLKKINSGDRWLILNLWLQFLILAQKDNLYLSPLAASQRGTDPIRPEEQQLNEYPQQHMNHRALIL